MSSKTPLTDAALAATHDAGFSLGPEHQLLVKTCRDLEERLEVACESLSASLRGGLQSARYAQELEDERVRLTDELARAMRVVEAARYVASTEDVSWTLQHEIEEWEAGQ